MFGQENIYGRQQCVACCWWWIQASSSCRAKGNAGHLCWHKTHMRVSACFYWTSMYSEIQKYCSTCPTSHYLHCRFAMNIDHRSCGGHQYIWIACDFANWFPKVFSHWTIADSAFLCATLQLFSRVGIPDEILMAQGWLISLLGWCRFSASNWASQQLGPLHNTHKLLRPNSYNQMLKSMIQTFVVDIGKNWAVGYCFCSLLTKRFHGPPLFSHPQSCSINGLSRADWICWERVERSHSPCRTTDVWSSMCWK